MLKLMKYELRKTAFSKLVLLVITAVAEVAFLLGIFLKKDNLLAMGIVFLFMCAVFGIIYIGIESVNVLHRDLNTKQSYMLFLTPKSGYQILGAKIFHGNVRCYWKSTGSHSSSAKHRTYFCPVHRSHICHRSSAVSDQWLDHGEEAERINKKNRNQQINKFNSKQGITCFSVRSK